MDDFVSEWSVNYWDFHAFQFVIVAFGIQYLYVWSKPRKAFSQCISSGTYIEISPFQKVFRWNIQLYPGYYF